MAGHKAHFICQDSTEREADIEWIWNNYNGLANLKVVSYEHKDYMFPVSSISYSSEPRPRSWHWAIACRHVGERV
jgi:hypothetical protein